jgi:molecular chaperone GrpE
MSKKVEKEVNNFKKNQPEGSASSPSEQPKETKPTAEKKEHYEKPEQKLSKDKRIMLMEEKISGLEKEIRVLKEKNLRLLADLDNQKKEHQREIVREEKLASERIKYSNEKLLEQFLFFPDVYERAMKYGQSESDPKFQNFLLGFKMILAEFQNVLKRQGIEEIKITPLKDAYNEELHFDTLKVEEEEENSSFPKGTILEVFKKGYRVQDRVLRPATVKISKMKEIETKNEKK